MPINANWRVNQTTGHLESPTGKELINRFDVRAFGADPTGATDSTAAIQAAIDAAPAGSTILLRSIFRTTAALVVDKSLTFTSNGAAFGGIRNTGTNKSTFYVDGAADVTFDRIAIHGNQSGEGSATANGDGGHGVKLNAAAGVTIKDCWFSGIGKTGGVFSSCGVFALGTSARVRVSGCYADDTCSSDTGSFVATTYGSTDTIITGNQVHANFDSGFTLGGVVSSSSRHIVTDNIFVFANEDARHGGVVQYAGGSPLPAECIISNNYFQGATWTGLYFNPGSASPILPGDWGGFQIQNNTIAFCGGGSESPENINGGMVITCGARGGLVTGNRVFRSGYDANGDARTTAQTPGIWVAGWASSLTIQGNLLVANRAQGILLQALSSQTIDDVSVKANECINNGGYGIWVYSAGATSLVSDVMVQGNTVRSSVDINAIRVGTANGGNLQDVSVDANEVYCSASTPAAAGIYWLSIELFKGSITRNKIHKFGYGIDTGGGAGGRFSPENVLVRGNETYNCSTAVRLTSAGHNVVLDHYDQGSTTFLGGNTRHGTLIGKNPAGETVVKISGTAAPTSGHWKAGDTVQDHLTGREWQCVAGGNPGTWLLAKASPVPSLFALQGGTLWLDPTDATNVTGASLVPDATGSGNNFTQSTLGDRMALTTINGRPALQGALGDHLENASYSSSGPQTFLVAIEAPGSLGAGNEFILRNPTLAARADIFITTDGRACAFGGATLQTAAGVIAPGGKYILRVYFNGASSQIDVYRNGVATATVTGNAGTGTLTNAEIGSSSLTVGSQSWSGKTGIIARGPGDFDTAWAVQHLRNLYAIAAP